MPAWSKYNPGVPSGFRLALSSGFSNWVSNGSKVGSICWGLMVLPVIGSKRVHKFLKQKCRSWKLDHLISWIFLTFVDCAFFYQNIPVGTFAYICKEVLPQKLGKGEYWMGWRRESFVEILAFVALDHLWTIQRVNQIMNLVLVCKIHKCSFV